MITSGLFALTALLALFPKKDLPLFCVCVLFTIVHYLNTFFDPTQFGAFSFILEAMLCFGIAGLVLLSKSDWALAISGIMLLSIALILVEFIDYFMFNSTLETIYSIWIDVTTALELIILALAYNGTIYIPRHNRVKRRDNHNHSVHSMVS